MSDNVRALRQIRELIAAEHELTATMKLFEAAVARGDATRMMTARQACHDVLDKLLNGKEIHFAMILQQVNPGTTQ